MSTELEPDLQLEIADVLFIDIVGYSKLLINEQHESHPQWDLLRGDPRFDKIVASLAPQATRSRSSDAARDPIAISTPEKRVFAFQALDRK